MREDPGGNDALPKTYVSSPLRIRITLAKLEPATAKKGTNLREGWLGKGAHRGVQGAKWAYQCCNSSSGFRHEGRLLESVAAAHRERRADSHSIAKVGEYLSGGRIRISTVAICVVHSSIVGLVDELPEHLGSHLLEPREVGMKEGGSVLGARICFSQKESTIVAPDGVRSMS